ncbi:hypothetical protein SRABI96_04836 [Peribacillus sp. Bi96]|uniref:hypothetical protein n=1 Tax=unclassified Peribacillus TaxID=2675266 RepID=UPI001D3848BD|nr:hypothetical protein [Peribacillus sp. Bi96]CAH0307324.1 hypothetical protein SRABI96_04836 [Peribacillus sp. Bi96]
MLKKVTFSLVAVVIAGLVLLTNLPITHAAFYPVQKTGGAGLDIRTTPTINGKRVETNIPDGKKLWLYCYVNGESYKGSKIWDFADDNGYGGDLDQGYVPDYFIKTGSSKPVVGYCAF